MKVLTPTTKDLSIVIVSWNTRDLLDTCLHSLFEYSQELSLEVFVVDNASKDGTSEMVREKYPQTHLIRNQENPGFATANNQAIAKASAPFVLLLNPDTEVQGEALTCLLSYIQTHPRVGAVGPQVLNPDGTPQPAWNNAFPGIFNEVFAPLLPHRLQPRRTVIVDPDTLQQDTGRTFSTAWLGGVCLLVRSEVIAQIGPLDPGYFMYTEETDLCLRIANAGWELHHVGDACIVHYGGQSTRQNNLAMFYELYRSKCRYFRKHHGTLYAATYKGLIILGATIRCIMPYRNGGEDSRRYRYILRRLLAG